jgi:2-dehydro-3-deoxy-D-arabinonate dehydratase
MKLYRIIQGPVVQYGPDAFRLLQVEWDLLINSPNLIQSANSSVCDRPERYSLLPPIGTQEVWASGVTYFRSGVASSGGARRAEDGAGDFYAKVYSAERPELFFKSTAARVVGPHQSVHVRKDSKRNVAEAELTLVIDHAARIVGYTIGNDMSALDIEGENPLYLPQAKVYDGSCAIGPCIFLTNDPIPASTAISIVVSRLGNTAFQGRTTVSQIKRSFSQLVEYLYRETSFPTGCLLLTGTGIAPDASFTLQSGDFISITIEPIGTFTNQVS